MIGTELNAWQRRTTCGLVFHRRVPLREVEAQAARRQTTPTPGPGL